MAGTRAAPLLLVWLLARVRRLLAAARAAGLRTLLAIFAIATRCLNRTRRRPSARPRRPLAPAPQPPSITIHPAAEDGWMSHTPVTICESRLPSSALLPTHASSGPALAPTSASTLPATLARPPALTLSVPPPGSAPRASSPSPTSAHTPPYPSTLPRLSLSLAPDTDTRSIRPPSRTPSPSPTSLRAPTPGRPRSRSPASVRLPRARTASRVSARTPSPLPDRSHVSLRDTLAGVAAYSTTDVRRSRSRASSHAALNRTHNTLSPYSYEPSSANPSRTSFGPSFGGSSIHSHLHLAPGSGFEPPGGYAARAHSSHDGSECSIEITVPTPPPEAADIYADTGADAYDDNDRPPERRPRAGSFASYASGSSMSMSMGAGGSRGSSVSLALMPSVGVRDHTYPLEGGLRSPDRASFSTGGGESGDREREREGGEGAREDAGRKTDTHADHLNHGHDPAHEHVNHDSHEHDSAHDRAHDPEHEHERIATPAHKIAPWSELGLGLGLSPGRTSLGSEYGRDYAGEYGFGPAFGFAQGDFGGDEAGYDGMGVKGMDMSLDDGDVLRALGLVPITTLQVIYPRYAMGERVSKDVPPMPVIPPMTLQYPFSPAHACPLGWVAITHPEGALYFWHREQRMYTSANMYHPDVHARVSRAGALLRDAHAALCAARGVRVVFDDDERVGAEGEDDAEATDTMRAPELVLHLSTDAADGAVYYYLVDHDARALFWLSAFDPTEMLCEVAGVTSPAHVKHEIETHYWNHWELFPTGHHVARELLEELSGILVHATFDALSSTTSTAPYTPEDLQTMLNCVKKIGDAGQHGGHAACVVGRMMSIFAHERYLNFAGQPAARLNRDQTVFAEAARAPRSLLATVLSPALFFAPDVHMKALEKIWIDQMINEVPWKRFIKKLEDEWKDLILLATVLLSANAALLEVPDVDTDVGGHRSPTEILCYVSIMTSIGSIILGLLLVRQYRTKARDTAEEAARHLSKHTHATRGLETLAILYSLPYAGLMWGMVTFLAAFAFLCFWGTSPWTTVPVGCVLGCVGVLIAWCVHTGWEVEERVQRWADTVRAWAYAYGGGSGNGECTAGEGGGGGRQGFAIGDKDGEEMGGEKVDEGASETGKGKGKEVQVDVQPPCEAHRLARRRPRWALGWPGAGLGWQKTVAETV